jgi:hypothetical protein
LRSLFDPSRCFLLLRELPRLLLPGTLGGVHLL